MNQTQNYKGLLSNLDYLVNKIDSLRLSARGRRTEITELDKDVAVCTSSVENVMLARKYYQEAVSELYKESKGEVENVLQAAINHIFHDKDYGVKLELGDSRGVKELNIILIDNDTTPPTEVDMKDGVGKGVRTVLSFVLHSYYILNKNGTRILFLDEAYTYVSEGYVDRFFSFMSEFSKEKDFVIVIISQDTDFSNYSDKSYFVQDGVVVEMS